MACSYNSYIDGETPKPRTSFAAFNNFCSYFIIINEKKLTTVLEVFFLKLASHREEKLVKFFIIDFEWLFILKRSMTGSPQLENQDMLFESLTVDIFVLGR